MGANSFLFEQIPFQKGCLCIGAETGSHKIVSLVKNDDDSIKCIHLCSNYFWTECLLPFFSGCFS